MRELWDVIRYPLLALACRVIGHRWLDLPDDWQVTAHRICLRCLTHESAMLRG